MTRTTKIAMYCAALGILAADCTLLAKQGMPKKAEIGQPVFKEKMYYMGSALFAGYVLASGAAGGIVMRRHRKRQRALA